MDTGDVLHMLIQDESGATVAIGLYGSSEPDIVEDFNIGSVTDVDGNSYTTVTIGTQQWMVENLKTTHYADGTAIPNLTIDGDWIADVTGAYCWYNNDIVNATPYGALYNWYAVTNAHGLAPAGWRIPTESDLDALMLYVGGLTTAGIKLKEDGFTNWLVSSNPGTNDYGFTAVGAGVRVGSTGVFSQIRETVNFFNATNSKAYQILYNYDYVSKLPALYDKFGLSVRCVRDLI